MSDVRKLSPGGTYSSTVFRNRDGSTSPVFDKISTQITTARDRFSEIRKTVDTDPAALQAERTKLAKTVSGTSFRPPQSGRSIPKGQFDPNGVFKVSRYDGRDLTHLRDGPGPSGWPPETILDPGSLGTYSDRFVHATGDGRITSLDTYENSASAKMGGYIKGVNRSPGNKEFLEGHAEGGFWWSYTPGRDCHLVVRGLAVETYARHYRDLVDEGIIFAPQVSNVHLRQDNYFTVGYFNDDSSSLANYGKTLCPVGPGSVYYGDGQNANRSDGPYGQVGATGFPDMDELVRNGNRSLEFSCQLGVGAVANQTVYCFFGMQAFFYSDLDDVKATIRQGGTWQIHRMAISEVF